MIGYNDFSRLLESDPPGTSVWRCRSGPWRVDRPDGAPAAGDRGYLSQQRTLRCRLGSRHWDKLWAAAQEMGCR